MNTNKGSIVKQSGNDVEGCRSEKVLVQPNMRVFLQHSVKGLPADTSWTKMDAVIYQMPGGGGYFGLRSYGDVPTFRVDFLTQNGRCYISNARGGGGTSV